MSTLLEDKARELAQQPYAVKITHDETTEGGPIFVLFNPELPGCMAQGITVQEALENLADARQEYILSLLEDNLLVPLPEQYATHTGVGTKATMSMVFTIELPDETSDEQEQTTVSLRPS